jgi:ribose transport system ATP-binding protein
LRKHCFRGGTGDAGFERAENEPTDVLNAIYASAPGRNSRDRVAYVAGDRHSDGIFPDWTIAQNFDIRSLYDRTRGSWN